ncbi:unnamed protein product [Penicillium salamii]|uniref:Mg2+ transporter protein, CorA-like/Zinc transport protein ZntB n=1 Tax=Penicillium salamii TaxID=1612424 RepID=A0A9W4NC31_9EURO|nr:unnamed protein product [Penicillium salamii]CAG7977231.1 unnamed protein product [Penicillium salamii]CAG8006155.1 unnamed protein product [Penicillium salamii]CAG8203879.1 unnamed protein product [Penicillium salamii]CAG8326957.1 unnamed protein product [Penicillium salamii]
MGCRKSTRNVSSIICPHSKVQLTLILKVTPEDYTRAIISLSRRLSGTSIFPGNNYIDIREWMLQDRRLLNPARLEDDKILFASNSEQPHDLVVVYSSRERKWDVEHYRQEQHEAFYASNSAPVGGSGQIVFIRGFISPSWVSAIGSKYNVDPEFFRRHMDYLSASVERHSYGFPSLASSSNNIFRLCISTLLHRDNFGGQDLRSQRSNQSAELSAYKIQQLGSTKVSCGDSVVREHSTVCSSFSVIEQWISLCITKTNGSWAGKRYCYSKGKHLLIFNSVIAWMDQGRPLEQSPPGPWTSHIESRATPLPVLQHHPRMAVRTTNNRLNPHTNSSADVPQSTAILPLQYDSLIALVDLARRAPQDPLSMCIPLFAHAAFSEVQFLNLMETKIQTQINTIAEGIPADTLGTLQFFYNILNRHAQQLKDSTRALYNLAERSSQGLDGVKPQSPILKTAIPPGLGMGTRRRTSETETIRNVGSNSYDGAFTRNGLLEDYEQLHVRCVDLSKMCTRGITLAMNKATIEESRKAIEQSERLKRLTLLATLFIPLTFSSSLLGMNIDLLGQNAVRFWWFFVLCIPATMFTCMIYLWDWRVLKRCWVVFWKRCFGFRRDMTAERGEKDPSHIV